MSALTATSIWLTISTMHLSPLFRRMGTAHKRLPVSCTYRAPSGGAMASAVTTLVNEIQEWLAG
ncbi:hypothetical protein GCM10023158_33900 [Gluconacetobacter tumulicola]